MPLTSSPNEWTGVNLIAGPHEGARRGIYTTIVLAGFLVITYPLITLVDPTFGPAVPTLPVLIILVVLVLIAGSVSFFLRDKVLTSNGTLTGVTLDADVSPRANDVPFVLPGMLPGGWYNTAAYDFTVGRLTADAIGVSGIFSTSWKSVVSVKLVTPTISELDIKRIFGNSPKQILLRFSNAPDASRFCDLVQSHVTA